MTNDHEEDEPLDPTLERVRKRMVRLLVISIGIMVVGLMAVFGAIVYKIGNMPESETDAVVSSGEKNGQGVLDPEIYLDLAQGSTVVSADLVENRLLLNVRLVDGSHQLLVVDLEAGKVSSRISLSARP